MIAWILQLLLALLFLMAALTKFAGAEQSVQVFEGMHADPWLRYTIGVLEIFGAIGLVVPRACALAAACLAALMVGAAIAQAATVGSGIQVPVIYLVLSLAVLFFRRRSLLQLIGRAPSPPSAPARTPGGGSRL